MSTAVIEKAKFRRATETEDFPDECSATVVLHDVSWSFFERFLREMEESHVRYAYDNGEFELMPPVQFFHENSKKLIARMIETMCEEFDLPVCSAGSLTLKRKVLKKGIEPDECYYLENAEKVRGRRRVDLGRHPPPDLALEVDDTSSSLDRMRIYAALGIPELWRMRIDGLRIFRLRGGKYREVQESPHFPGVHIHDLNEFLRRSAGRNETQWIREFRARVQVIVAERSSGRP